MAVLKFRNFHIYKKIETKGYEDDNGDFHQGESEWSDAYPCELVPNAGRATVTKYQDGTTISYAYTIYLAKDCPLSFEVGDIVRVEQNGETIVEIDVKGAMRYQLQIKVWI